MSPKSVSGSFPVLPTNRESTETRFERLIPNPEQSNP
jgi:hypothetical protein